MSQRALAFLAILGLLACAALQSVGACASGFECANGECTNSIRDKCSGEPQCGDFSDEDTAMCNKLNVTHLDVGDTATVRAQHDRKHGAIEVHLCNLTRCSVLTMEGFNASGVLAYTSYTDCNEQGHGDLCTSTHEGHQLYPRGWSSFRTGEVVLKVQRWLSHFAVWLEGHSDKAVQVPAEAKEWLRVRPWKWRTDMPMQVTVRGVPAGPADPAAPARPPGPRESDVPHGPKAPCGEFTCKNGKCAEYSEKCDGANDCGDNSDEDTAMCSNKLNNLNMTVGQKVTVRVAYQSSQGLVEFIMCGKTSCSCLNIHGSRPDGTLAFVSTKDCDEKGHSFSLGNFTNSIDAKEFDTSELKFIVERRPHELAVWLPCKSKRAVTVPISSDSHHLQVQPGTSHRTSASDSLMQEPRARPGTMKKNPLAQQAARQRSVSRFVPGLSAVLPEGGRTRMALRRGSAPSFA